jgi:hypothetical protein
MKRRKNARPARTSQHLNRSTSQPKGAHSAFLESGGHLFMSERLQPYTPSRIVAAQAMGLLYPKIGNDGLAQLKKTGLYPGELKDIIIVLWLCRLKTKEQVADARLDPIAAYEDAEKWAGKIGLCDMTSDAFGYGLLVFQNIMNEIGESKTTPVVASRPGATSDEEEPDPND